MKITSGIFLISFFTFLVTSAGQVKKGPIPPNVMQTIYDQVKTPYKYGLVMVPSDNSKKIDCPSIFRLHGMWHMTYLVFDGRGYETWLAKSSDLLTWKTTGRILSFSGDSARWDWNQKAAYISLQDYRWGGSYRWNKFRGKYWMSYFGGNTKGYEAGTLSLGMAFTDQDPSAVHEWNYLEKPVLSPFDKDVRWWENSTMYKSTVIKDEKKLTGHPFVMYYNARGDSLNPRRGAERIGMAVSDDMVSWQRYMKNPVINHHRGISGDAFLQKAGDVFILFYFGAFWNRERSNAFNRFACSYDLVNWTDWDGPDLISPSESYDNLFAHKSFVIKWKGVVYHFYCAVNKKEQRGIAVATSINMGKSTMEFVRDQSGPALEPKK